MRPTGRLHLGNYMGALYNWVQLQHQYEVLLLHRRLPRPHHRLRRYQQPKGQYPRGRPRLPRRPASIPRFAPFLFSRMFLSTRSCTCSSACSLRLACLNAFQPTRTSRSSSAIKTSQRTAFWVTPLLQSADILLYQPRYVPVGQDQGRPRRAHARGCASLQ